MKNNIRLPATFGIGVLAAAGIIIGALGVSAQAYSTTTNAVIPSASVDASAVVPVYATTTTTAVAPIPVAVIASYAPVPEVLSVEADGTALLRGTAQAGTGAANQITVRGWGGMWIVRTNAATQIISATPGDLSTIPAGDFVGVAGVIAQDQPWTIDASVVHDWTASPPQTPTPAASASADTTSSAASSSSYSGAAPTTIDASSSPSGSSSMIPAGDALYTGVASDVSALGSGSFTLTGSDGGSTYVVNVASDATVWNTASSDIPLSGIVQGDSIRLDGVIQTDGSINADVVRDTSQ